MEALDSSFCVNANDNILVHQQAILLTLTNTFTQLIYKCLTAFVAYIMEDYGFSYVFTISALSIGSLATCVTLVANPLVLYLPTNVLFCVFLLLQSVSCFILWYFRHSKVLFIVAVIIIFIIENMCYGCSTAVISTFTTNSSKTHNYLSALNSSWTIATFLFLVIGCLMKIGAIWLCLEILFVIFVILAILNIMFLPQQSANAYNLSKDESLTTVNIKDDMRVLFKIKPYWCTLLALFILFIAWGYFYSSFGLWLKAIFSLDEQRFGFIAGLTEGFGNLFGILTVTYFAKSEGEAKDKSSYKIRLQTMMLWTCLLMTLAIAVIWFINFVQWYNEIFIFTWIGLYFYGLEACFCSGLILMVNVVPPLQQARTSAMLGVVQCVAVFFAQSTVAPLYYNFDGMKWESFLLIFMYLLSLLVIIYLNKIMKDHKFDEDELFPINKDKLQINSYT